MSPDSTTQLKEVEIPLKSSPNSHRTVLLVRDVEELIKTILKHSGENREEFMVWWVQYRILLYVLADHFLENGNAWITREELSRRSGYKVLPQLLSWIFNIRRVDWKYHVLGWEK